MALKKKLTKAAFEKLSDEFKKEYKEDGDDYVLDVEGDDDTGELRRANDRLKQEAKDAKAKAKEVQDKLAALGDDDARKAGDVVTLEKSWKEKYQKLNDEKDAVIEKQKNHITGQLVDNVAAEIAAKLSDAPKLLIPHIKARLVANFDGAAPETRVLDATGKISALTVDDLSKEISSNKDFSAIIRVSKASGAGGTKTPASQYQTGGLSQQEQQQQNPALMSPTALRERVEAKIAERNNQ